MTVLVTGSAGHLGEALMRRLRADREPALGLDIKASPYTDVVASITDRDCVREAMRGVHAVVHTATLHKPHVGTHSREEFVATNVTGTLMLLEEAARAGVSAFVFTSTTSAFGAALTPDKGAPASWITEDVHPVPKNIYGATKVAAEGLCELFARTENLPVLVLRTSRFFPEEDDNPATRTLYATANAQANELLYRRVDVEDIVESCLLAVARAPALGFGRYIISATTPFTPQHTAELQHDAATLVRRLYPACSELYAARDWKLFPAIDRVYVNDRARRDLGWLPKYDFAHVLAALKRGEDFRSPTARAVGVKRYHTTSFTDGPYPVC